MDKCNSCNIRGMRVRLVTRMAGGGYNRPQRRYESGVCRWCIAGYNERVAADNRSYSERVGDSYLAGSIAFAHKANLAEREEIGDAETGRLDALWYWNEYKRLNPIMAERLAAETEEYRKGFESEAH